MQNVLSYNREESLALWEKSGVPTRHRTRLEFKNDDWKTSCDLIKAKTGEGYIFALLGDRGRGKTQMAVDVARYTCKASLSVKYTKALEIFITLRESMKSDGERTILNQHIYPSLLIIDAMEERGETQWEDRLLNHIVDRRYEEMKDTILISNQTKDGFIESVGHSIASRIKETGRVVECNWESFR